MTRKAPLFPRPALPCPALPGRTASFGCRQAPVRSPRPWGPPPGWQSNRRDPPVTGARRRGARRSGFRPRCAWSLHNPLGYYLSSKPTEPKTYMSRPAVIGVPTRFHRIFRPELRETVGKTVAKEDFVTMILLPSFFPPNSMENDVALIQRTKGKNTTVFLTGTDTNTTIPICLTDNRSRRMESGPSHLIRARSQIKRVCTRQQSHGLWVAFCDEIGSGHR